MILSPFCKTVVSVSFHRNHSGDNTGEKIYIYINTLDYIHVTNKLALKYPYLLMLREVRIEV